MVPILAGVVIGAVAVIVLQSLTIRLRQQSVLAKMVGWLHSHQEAIAAGLPILSLVVSAVVLIGMIVLHFQSLAMEAELHAMTQQLLVDIARIM